jgi:hypothetical protein
VRWKVRKKTITGMTPRRAAALRAVGSLVYWPRVTDRPSGTVWLSLEMSRTSGWRNSFQLQTKRRAGRCRTRWR